MLPHGIDYLIFSSAFVIPLQTVNSLGIFSIKIPQSKYLIGPTHLS